MIRTSNFSATKTKGLNDVFKIASGKNSWDWVRNWGTLAPTGTIQTGQVDATTGDITEVVAENVLGWRVNPIYWDPLAADTNNPGKKGKMVIDAPATTPPTTPAPRYYDNPQVAATTAKPPKYITSDLKYVKKSDTTLANITTNSAPRAIEIRLVTVPSNAVTRLKSLTGWSAVRETSGLFDLYKLTDTPFNNLLKQNAQAFDATFYLSSKTP
jgi:hypothetical protein